MPTPPETGPPMRRPPLEPTHVLRRRRPRALSDLLAPSRRDDDQDHDLTENYESVAVPTTKTLPRASNEDTQELPPVAVGTEEDGGWGRREQGRGGRVAAYSRWRRSRRSTIAATALLTAALVGFGIALLLPQGESRSGPPAGTPAPTTPTAPEPSIAPSQAAADPDGPGTLREGDSGPAVTDLQERLLRIPNVYEDGSASGSYDATLTAAVSRFQLWYGIRGDETGVYGNDTRLDLESRTTP